MEGRYRDIQLVGQGSFGRVCRAVRCSDGATIAVKEVDLNLVSQEFHATLEREYIVSKNLNHKNILRYLDMHREDNNLLLIEMELCTGNSLDDLIKMTTRSNETIPEDIIWEIVAQICDGLEYLHDPSKPDGRIIHRDLKPDNIMFTGTALKIGDLGLARKVDENTNLTVHVGTLPYMAPEVAHCKEYDTSADIWSLGCIIYELCWLKRPTWDARTLFSDPTISVPGGYSSGLREIIASCVRFNPSARMTLAALKENRQVYSAQVRLNKHTDDFLVAVRESNMDYINSNITVLDSCINEAVNIARRDRLYAVMLILAQQVFQRNFMVKLDPIKAQPTAAKTPLFVAAETGNWKKMKPAAHMAELQKYCTELLTLPGGTKDQTNPRYVLNATALMVAAHYGHTSAISNLLPEVGMCDSQGCTALMYAARRGHDAAVALLLSETGARNEFGHTALMLAAWYGHKECVRILYSREGTIRDTLGRTASDYAKNTTEPVSAEEQKSIMGMVIHCK